MTDSDILDLLDHYGWSAVRRDGVWSVGSGEVSGSGEDIRTAVYEALKSQFRWATRG